MSKSFNTTVIRDLFPSLTLRIGGQKAIFFDGPGGTQTPQAVIDAMGHYLAHSNSNLGGAFLTSRESDKVVETARHAVADLFNAKRSEEIAFGQNMTSLTFAASRAISRDWRAGDEIIVTRLDHDANITPWVLAAEDRDVKVRWLDFRPEDCTLDIEALPGLLSKRTRLVAVSYASNAVGTIVDVARIAEIAHHAGALVYVDAVHYTPHNRVDVQAIDADFLVASAYKFFGPHTGILYGKYEHLERLKAYKVRPAPASPPGKWETGTQSFESLAGVTAAIEYLRWIGQEFGKGPHESLDRVSRRETLKAAMASIKEYESMLSQYFLEGVTSIPGLRVYGITDVERLEERAPTFAISLGDLQARDVAEHLGDNGIFTWDGHYYAVAVMERLGVLDTGGLLRIGFAHYNTTTEIDRLIYQLEQISKP